MDLNVKVDLAAKLMCKSPMFIRMGLRRKLLPFGTAVQVNGKRWSYHISAGKFCDYMGLAPEDLVVLMHSAE